LPTIRSRCQALRFESLEPQTITDVLTHLGVSSRIDQNSLFPIAERAGGSVRTAAILAEGGGLDILQAADEVIAAPAFNAGLALKIGEAVSQRDAEPLFHLLVDDLLKRLADAARRATQKSHREAGRLAKLQQDAAAQVVQSLKFNLDRKPLIMQLLLTAQGATLVS
jgi:DNA polymerase III subunit delta'